MEWTCSKCSSHLSYLSLPEAKFTPKEIKSMGKSPAPVIRNFPYDIPDDGSFMPQVGDVIEVTFTETGSVVRGTVSFTEIGSMCRAFSKDSFILFTSMSPTPMSFRLLKRERKFAVGDVITGHDADSLPVGTILHKVGKGVYSVVYPLVILSTLASSGTQLNAYRYRRIDVVQSWPSITGEWLIQYLPPKEN